jgi:hypothetical protein
MLAVEPPWVEASTGEPCPSCGAADGCAILEDGEFVRCLAVPSRWPVAQGGWLHRAAELGAPAG